MSYLEYLRHLYKEKLEPLRDEFNDHFTKIVNEKLKQVIPKIKEQIEDNIVEYVTNYKLKTIDEIDLEGVDITEIYNDKFSSLFVEYLKEEDYDVATKSVEDFIEQLEVFKNVEKVLETRFDGLKFSVFCHVNLENKVNYTVPWGIDVIEITLYAYLSDW